MKQTSKPLVGILMGSDSDLPVMEEAAAMLKKFGVHALCLTLMVLGSGCVSLSTSSRSAAM